MWEPQYVWQKITNTDDSVVVEEIKISRRSKVYRLKQPSGNGNIIAKRCRERCAVLERLLYETVLAGEIIRAPKLMGFIAEPDCEEKYYWLLMEDLGPRRHDPTDPGERHRLATWLGTLARLTISLPPPSQAQIPVRSLHYYKPFLSQAMEELPKVFSARSFSSDVHRLCNSTLRALLLVERSWPKLDAAANASPRILVHGDCLPKNIHVVEEPGIPVVPIDWGAVGLGLPGIDLGVSSVSLDGRIRQITPDIEAYVSAIRPVWPEVDARGVERLAITGRILWTIKLLAQSALAFHGYSRGKVEAYFTLYANLLDSSVADMGWRQPMWK